MVLAWSGLRDVIVDAQKRLLSAAVAAGTPFTIELDLRAHVEALSAAVAAGTPRFIPSNYCIDYAKLPNSSNRNLDLRRVFNQRLD